MIGDLLAALILCPLGFHQWTSGEYLLDVADGGKGTQHPAVLRCSVRGKRR
jgi:hypothetical protein